MDNIGKDMADCFDKVVDKITKSSEDKCCYCDVQRLIRQVVELQAENKAKDIKNSKLGKLLKECILHLIEGGYFTVEELEQFLKENDNDTAAIERENI